MTTPLQPAATPKATRREWIGLAVIALPCLVYAMDLTVLNLAIPALSAELKPSTSQLLWIIDIYGFLVAGFLITMGNLGDRIGRRKLLMAGAAAFAAASVLAAFADSAAMLIAMRALLGIAGATLAPSTMSLIRNMFHDEHERQFAIGVWIASFSVGGAIGPLVGGVLIEWFWWGSVFLPAVPVMGLLLILGPRLLPEYRDASAPPLDLASALQSLAAVLALIFGVKQFAEAGATPLALASLAAGLLVGTAFVRRQTRLAYPLLDLTLFSNRRFAAGIAAFALSCLAMMGSYIFITQYLQLVLGLSPLGAGIATLPWAVSFVFGSLYAPRLARRWAPARLIGAGLGAAVAGFVLLAFVDGPWALALLVASSTVISLGLAPVFTIGNEMIITAAPPERAGAASAISETAAEFSGAIGIAVFGSVGMLLYRGLLGPALPASMAPALADDALATLGGALAASEALGGTAGAALLDTARRAFGESLRWSGVAAAAIVALAWWLSVRILSRGTPAPTPAVQPSTQPPAS